MKTVMVEPSIGMLAGGGVNTQPKFTMTPDTVSPCPGVSIVPNGRVAVELDAVNVREPSTT